MKMYKGIYLDGYILKTPADVDAFLLNKAVSKLKVAASLFAETRSAAAMLACDIAEERLVTCFGFTWEQVEEIETEQFKLESF